VTANLYVFVAEGGTNHDTGWTLTTNDAIAVNVTGLVFAQFTGGAAYTAGNELVIEVVRLAVAPAANAYRVVVIG
jgi:hypothetical protein